MSIDLKVWGCYACFTRPEFKVERVSYRVMTPSAARGVLEAIYWKPQIRYRIKRIGILELGSEWSLLRNEISSRQNAYAKGMEYVLQVLANPEAQEAGKGKTKLETAHDIARRQFTVVDEDRQQRTSLVLKDACYRIQASIELRNGETNIGKHLDCFRRRAEKGQYFHKPFLGCREFAADFEWLGEVQGSDTHVLPNENLNLSIGTMLYDTAYIESSVHYESHPEDRLEFWRHDADDKPREARGYAKRFFFDAEVRNGWLVEKGCEDLPDSLFREISRLEDANGNP